MLLILTFHTEVYYRDSGVTPYYVYTTNAIVVFYFISGYLFYRKSPFNLKNKLTSIFRSMVVPYFLFTTLIAVTKMVLQPESLAWQDALLKIVCGRASWFVVALIVAEVFFSLFLCIRQARFKWLSAASAVCFISYYLVDYNQNNFWQWQDALLTFFFLYLGYLYHHKETMLNAIQKPCYSLILLIILVVIKLFELNVDYDMRNIAVVNPALFLADTIITLLLVISVLKLIPRCSPLEWIGKHSIVYYFLSGAAPLIITLSLHRIGLPCNDSLLRFLMVLIAVYLLSTCLTWIINKYLPFLIGKTTHTNN